MSNSIFPRQVSQPIGQTESPRQRSKHAVTCIAIIAENTKLTTSIARKLNCHHRRLSRESGMGLL